MSPAPILLRDVITIPESVHKGDLVYQLADAADDPAITISKYVVTDQLRQAFLDAVGIVKSSVNDRSSKAAYLHGSFGSGKSNFMGVLQLLLDGHSAARAVPELADVVADIDSWRNDRRFLTVPFHLIGEHDLESAVFGQYVAHLARTHPDAPPPAVFADEPLLENGDGIRASVGDDQKFFETLSEGASGDGGWGALGDAWTAETYDVARSAPHGSPDRIRLVQALTGTWLSGFGDVARANRSGYVNFADGLAAISLHAQSLGYGGVILFLDELILWFLSRLGDTAWVNAEASKLSKLVEASSASRPVPIISIIARQRDLRELVGDSVPGAEKLSFADQLSYQEGRFDTIRLDDSNLPVVANRRLLTPRDPEAAGVLRSAFESLSLSPAVKDALLAERGDDATFALTYPFSPAFMTVLVDVAGALQRTRTGLRVLLDLLVARRDVLEVGQLVPVGDLYEVIADSDDPFSDAMRSAFDQARKIYLTRLRPALLDEHHLTEAGDLTPAFLNDDRLVKTLLLAALVPQSVPFKDLTVARLVALNHGLISSPIPGQETTIVANKLRRLASRVGELRLGSDANNPTVSIVLADVDTTAILAFADGADNTANRRTLIKDLVLGGLGLPTDQMQTTYTTVWRGLRRDVSVSFGNIRDTAELPDAVFANDTSAWKLVIDFPFDDPGHTPLEDLERLDRFRQNNTSWSTLCWLPSFFTAQTLDTLGRLVRLNHVLANDDRFAEATSSLSPIARASAKPLLQAMQTSARNELDAALLGGYGVIGADERVIDSSHPLADHFPCLRAGLSIQPPTRPSLREALEQVLDQAYRHTYPGAPDLGSGAGAEVKAAEVRKVAELCADAVVEPDGRLRVNDTADRRLLSRIANPLRLGVQSEQAFSLQRAADHWDQSFTKAINQALKDGADSATVGLLRSAINTPDASGLTTQLENLIILVWAQATSHSFREHGGPASVSVDRLDDSWEVVEQALPDATTWQEACDRLASVFGVALSTRQLSGFAVERAGMEIAHLVSIHSTPVNELVERLTDWSREAGREAGTNERLATAECASALLGALGAAERDLDRVEALAAAEIRPSGLALGRSITAAARVVQELDAAQRQIIVSAAARPEGSMLAAELATALLADEFVSELTPVLHDVQQRSIALVTVVKPPVRDRQTWTGKNLDDAERKLDELRTKLRDQVLAEESVEITIEWTEAPLDADGDGATTP